MNFKSSLRMRWLVNTLGVILALGMACVFAITALFANYYYSNIRSDLYDRAESTADFFADYLNQSYNEYYQSCINYAQSFSDKDRLELQFISKDGTLVASSYGQWAGQSPTTSEIQEAIRDNCPEEFFTLIMRRFMMEISARIARQDGCGALITGENLGQVASQTMEAMTVTGAVVDMPIFMPLIGMDKEEIVTIARKIGTFQTSVLPYEDCCTVFTPRHPKTKPTLGQVINAERKLDRQALIEQALATVEKIPVIYGETEPFC